jgi:hypothetical protein
MLLHEHAEVIEIARVLGVRLSRSPSMNWGIVSS